MSLRALLWDVDGTIAETERDGHRIAFNEAFESVGLPWRWDDAHYGRLLTTTGGRERLLRDMAGRADAPSDPREREALAEALHQAKNASYAKHVAKGSIEFRPGVRELMEDAQRAGLPQAIVTTTSRANVDALVRHHLGPNWTARFQVVITGEDVPRKKPAPDAYEQALQRLSLPPGRTLALEDSPAGVAAARAAGVPVVVTPSVYFPLSDAHDALATGPSLHDRRGWRPLPLSGMGRVTLADLCAWHLASTPPHTEGV
jgi:HAD superfamily hydrolase (TIGR01509 family)